MDEIIKYTKEDHLGDLMRSRKLLEIFSSFLSTVDVDNNEKCVKNVQKDKEALLTLMSKINTLELEILSGTLPEAETYKHLLNLAKFVKQLRKGKK